MAAAPASQSTPGGSAPSGYPPALKNYIFRAYKAVPGEDPARKQRVEDELRTIMQECDRWANQMHVPAWLSSHTGPLCVWAV